MEMLNVPVTNMTQLKKSPAKVIQQAIDTKNGVYVFNRDTPAAVIMTPKEYEKMITKINNLEEKILDMEVEEIAKERINQHSNTQGSTPEKIFGQSWNDIKLDEDDGWE